MREFLRWWLAQLAASLPAGLRGRDTDVLTATVVALTSPPGASPVTVEVTRPGRGRLPLRQQPMTLSDAGIAELRDALGPGRPPPVRLRLPHGVLLERDVILPIAAERAPEQVLHYELDRLTPFRADEMLWGFEITERDRTRGRLLLRLTLAPLAILSPLLDCLRRIGVVPVLLEAEPPAGNTAQRRRRIVLGSARPSRHPKGLRMAWAACAALAVAAAAVPFIGQSLALAAIQARIDALQPSVAEAEALRRHAAAVAASDDVMQSERQRLGDPLLALAAATEALPDDTWLTDLTLHQRKLTLAGQSRDAVRLIGRLSAESGLRNASFTAPVTRSQTGRGDLFSIGAELQP
jgi:general secretion pathway protein L